jgi:exopolyphosphatase/pppGpp-phosphohydrolase
MLTRKSPLIAIASVIGAAVLVRGVFSQSIPQEGSICAIDMGSNTFRRIVGSFHNGQYVQRSIEKKALGVGDDLAKHGRISEPKLTEIGAVLSAFRSSCLRDGATKVVAVGTAAFRDAPNGGRVRGIAANAGVEMEIASERPESELAYLVASLGRDDYAVIDHGSRSIELVSKSGGTLRYVVSSLGYRVAYEKFFAAESRLHGEGQQEVRGQRWMGMGGL